MPSKKLAAPAKVNRQVSEEASESDSNSGSNHASDQSHDSSASDSDSLDDAGSRKRRKISPVVVDDEDDEEDDEPAPKVVAPTSRLKSRIQKGRDSKIEEFVPPPPTSITAPLDHSTTFESLGVKPWLVGALNSMAIKRPTGIQKGCIPEIIKGRDCIGGSRTGSGKTVAFAVPILQQWAEDPFGIFAVVLTPTR